ncbi:MAG: hypothetical protein EP330_09800 [Deltaproteobacteria bacterium]|nr:MAG: hypothetical protein EP330_09800 [Deltaproteobacteria bacterium]
MFHDFLVLGGAGLVGLQVCRQIAMQLEPRRIVVASLKEREARDACTILENEFGDAVAFVPAWGNLFVQSDIASTPRDQVLGDAKMRRKLIEELYGDFDVAYKKNHLVGMIRLHRPEVVVDCVNTATGLSYQNVFVGANKVLERLQGDSYPKEGVEDLEHFLLSQSVPQLIRHVRFLHRATTEYGTRVYVKVGTTGTGGMGLNIPYTHSEDKPSRVLLAKTEAAFGHTGLLFLLARTPNSPIVKEVKPAAMIGYRAVRTMSVSDKHGNTSLFQPKVQKIAGDFDLRDEEKGYEAAGELVVSVVDTGENGVFTRGEFAAITALGQMEYITPEEIARIVTLEIRGANTGQDVLSALDGAVLNPSYKAGLVRSVALSDLKHAEQQADLPSIALGKLGPPELSKLLFEAQLLKESFESLRGILEDNGTPRDPKAMSKALTKALENSAVRHIAPSIGIPILAADGKSLLRGPRVNVPEVTGHSTTVSLDDTAQVEKWAQKGWIDLRPANMRAWRDRVSKMVEERILLRDAGSAAASIRSYLPTEFEIGEVVAWIFNNEMGGHRIK